MFLRGLFYFCMSFFLLVSSMFVDCSTDINYFIHIVMLRYVIALIVALSQSFKNAQFFVVAVLQFNFQRLGKMCSSFQQTLLTTYLMLLIKNLGKLLLLFRGLRTFMQWYVIVIAV